MDPSSSPSSSTSSRAQPSRDYLIDLIYLAPTTHPLTEDRIIVFSLAALSDVSEDVTDDELFSGLMDRCETWVNGDGDDVNSRKDGSKGYVLVILASEGEQGARSRGRGFRIWRWRSIPRSFKKNLKRMYIIHPTRFTRTILTVVLPFLSPKAYRKIYPLSSLVDLYRIHGVSLAGMRLTLPVLRDEASAMTAARPPHSSGEPAESEKSVGHGDGYGGVWYWYAGLRGLVGAATSYLPVSYPYSASAPSSSSSSAFSASPAAASYSKPDHQVGSTDPQAGPRTTTHPTRAQTRGVYGRSAEELVQECGAVPRMMDDMRRAILAECSGVEGIFRISPGAALRPPLVALLSLPMRDQPIYPWADIARLDPYLLPKLLMRIFASAPGPYIPVEAYGAVRSVRTKADLDQFLHWSPSAQQHLSPARVLLLQHMITTFRLLSPHEEHTRMSARNYTICFAPDLIRGPNPLEDLELCLEPGKALPLSMTKQVGGAGGQMERAESKGLRGRGNTLVGVLELWIRSDAVGH